MFSSFKKWGSLVELQGITCDELASHVGEGGGGIGEGDRRTPSSISAELMS